VRTPNSIRVLIVFGLVGFGILMDPSDLTGHFKAGQQLSIARFPTHLSFGRAMVPVIGVEICPLFCKVILDFLLSLEAILFHPRLAAVLKSNVLASDALTDLLYIYYGDAV
jgi:hypothetical protein